VIFWPPYFFLIAAALGTFGAVIAAAFCTCDGLLLLLAAATLREATSAIAPIAPARISNLPCFTLPRPFMCRPHTPGTLNLDVTSVKRESTDLKTRFRLALERLAGR